MSVERTGERRVGAGGGVEREALPPMELVLSSGEAGGARLVLVGVEAKVRRHLAVHMKRRAIRQEPVGRGHFSWDEHEDLVRSWWDLTDEPTAGQRRRDRGG